MAIQNVNLEFIGESTTGISRWYLKWKLDKINEGVDEDRRGEIAYKGDTENHQLKQKENWKFNALKNQVNKEFQKGGNN